MSRAVMLPESLAELWSMWRDAPEAMVYTGGTDLLVRLREKVIDPPVLICLERIESLKDIAEDGQGLRIGSAAPHSRIAAHDLVRRHLPILGRAIATLGSPPIRHMGTMGGNIRTASPAGDTLPPLYVLEAELELVSKQGSRRMPVQDFILGPGKTAIAPLEIIGHIWVKKPAAFQVHHYEKVGLRNALACSVAGLAALIALSEDDRITQVRLAWGSVGPTVLRLPDIEDFLTGKRLVRETLEQAAALVRQNVRPIDDVRASADYRRQVSGNLMLRLRKYAGPSYL